MFMAAILAMASTCCWKAAAAAASAPSRSPHLLGISFSFSISLIGGSQQPAAAAGVSKKKLNKKKSKTQNRFCLCSRGPEILLPCQDASCWSVEQKKEELAPRQSKQTTNGPIPNDQKTERSSDRPPEYGGDLLPGIGISPI